MWAGSLIPLNAVIILVAESEAQVQESTLRLARVGIENVKGYLSGGVESWMKAGFELSTTEQLTVDQLRDWVEKEDLQVLDVRRPAEYESGHVPHALSSPLANLERKIEQLPLDSRKSTAVICAGGYRSSAAASLLEKHGFKNLLNVTGGTSAWINAGFPVEVTQ